MLRPRIVPGLFALLFAGAIASQVASCQLTREGTVAEAKPVPCTVDANCDDNNPCTTAKCNVEAGECEFTVLTDEPAPVTEQQAADCKRIQCVGGVSEVQNDPADVPNDNNTCTEDICASGTPTNNPLMDGTACLQGNKSGECEGASCVVSCTSNTDCDDGNPCTDNFCNTSTSRCVFTNIDGLPTPGVMQAPGDCQVRICIGGTDTPVADDGDLPDDDNSCTQNTCVNGEKMFPGQPAGSLCNPMDVKVCDGNGACVECVEAANCVNIEENECVKRSCVDNKCVPSYPGNDTLASPTLQTPSDCKKVVCNGAGGTTTANEDADVPIDGNLCTKDVCTNGTPSNPPEPVDTGCGNGLVCNATGTCVGCNTADQCAGTDDFCKKRACNSGQCGFTFTAKDTALPDMSQVDNDCKVVVCDGAGNIVTNVDTTDVPFDNNPCTKDLCSMSGTPSNPNEPINTTCMTSGGNDACDGNGTCKKSNGKTCAVANECVNAFCVDGVCCESSCSGTCRACNVANNLGNCVNVPAGSDDAPSCSGTAVSCDGSSTCKKENGQGCSNQNECLSGNCVDGVCCNTGCTDTCRACNIANLVGTCSTLPAGSQDTNAATPCTGMNQCTAGGACQQSGGTSCTMASQCASGNCVDGVCCNEACTGMCKTCNLGMMAGTCVNMPANQEDTNPVCSGSNACDGNGTCKKKNGHTCSGGMANASCLSNFCVDGVCCDSACTATCKRCNFSGSLGTCSNTPNGQDDGVAAMTCTGANQSCDGNGNCKKENGQICGAAMECLSGFCADGYCCNTACMGTCNACSALAKGQGANGTCGAIIEGSDPQNECMNGACDGNGACALDNGETCSANTQCLSNFCVDTVCCVSACDTACKSCNLPGNAGACVNLPQYQDDNNPMCSGANTCDGTGACLKDNGQMCGNKSECASDKCAGGNCAP